MEAFEAECLPDCKQDWPDGCVAVQRLFEHGGEEQQRRDYIPRSTYGNTMVAIDKLHNAIDDALEPDSLVVSEARYDIQARFKFRAKRKHVAEILSVRWHKVKEACS